MIGLSPEFIARLDRLRLAVRWVRAGHGLGGRFPLHRRGSSIEFDDYASYTPGDDIRAIDWPLYARLDRLFVKTYKEEITLSVELVLDATASMALPTPRKFERAAHLALSLGAIALAGGHRVRMTWIAPGEIVGSAWIRHRRDFFREAGILLEPLRARGTVSWRDWMRRAAITRRWRGGQVIFLTDGMVRLPELFGGLQELLARHLEIKLLQILSPEELMPSRLIRSGMLVDAETGRTHQLADQPEVLTRAMAEHNEAIARFCTRHGIRFAQHGLDESLDACLTKTLTAHGFLVTG